MRIGEKNNAEGELKEREKREMKTRRSGGSVRGGEEKGARGVNRQKRRGRRM